MNVKIILAILVGAVIALMAGATLHAFGLNNHAWAIVPIALGVGSGWWVWRFGFPS